MWQGFWELSSSRGAAFSVLPLTIADITAWMDLQGYKNELQSRVFYLLKQMDAEFMQFVDKRTERRKKDADTRNRNRRKRK